MSAADANSDTQRRRIVKVNMSSKVRIKDLLNVKRPRQNTTRRIVPYHRKSDWRPYGPSPAPIPEPTEKDPHKWQLLSALPEWKKQHILKMQKDYGPWKPEKKLGREEMQSLRLLAAQHPTINISKLSKMYGISANAVVKILKSSWAPQAKQDAPSKKTDLLGEKLQL